MQKIIAPLALYLAIGAGVAALLKDATTTCPLPPSFPVVWAAVWPLSIIQLFSTNDQCAAFAKAKR